MSEARRELPAISEKEREEALRRFQILRPALEEGVPVSRIAKAKGIPQRTLKRWIKNYREGGLDALARNPRSDRGSHRGVSPETRLLIEGLALQKPRPTAAHVYRQVASVTEQKGWKVPSYEVVARIIRNLDPALVSLAHEGSKRYKEAYDLIYRRESTMPNEIWQADHSVLDIYLVGDDGKPARPWLTIVMDDYSRAVAGYFLSFRAPSIINTALALRQAIWRKDDPRWQVCGIPNAFYTDHGSDFTSRHMEQVSADLKMALVFSIPGAPRGRGRIERFFQTVSQLFLCRLPGYSPAGSPPAAPKLTLAEFDRLFRSFLLDEYHVRVHSTTGMAPHARWEAGGFLPQMPESLEQLDLLMICVAKTRRVRPDGIHFQGLRYIDLSLAAYVGEDVIIRYDPRDLAEIRVYHQERFLCRALCQELAGETLGIREITAARNRQRRHLRKSLADRSELVESLFSNRAGERRPAEPDSERNWTRLRRRG